MKFEEDKSLERVGEKIGFVFGYFILTTILFLIIKLKKSQLEYWQVMLITLAIALAGIFIKKSLK